MGFTSDSLKVGEPYPYYYSARGSPLLRPYPDWLNYEGLVFRPFYFYFSKLFNLLSNHNPACRVGQPGIQSGLPILKQKFSLSSCVQGFLGFNLGVGCFGLLSQTTTTNKKTACKGRFLPHLLLYIGDSFLFNH